MWNTDTHWLVPLGARYLATPLADVLGVKDKVRRTVEPNPLLENYYSGQAKVPSQVC